MSASSRRFRWLRSESRRAWAAMVPTVAVMIVLSLLVDLTSAPSTPQVWWQALLWGWTAYAIVHTFLTWWAFHGLAGPALVEAMTSHPQHSARRSGLRRFAVVRWLLGASDSAPSWSVQVSLLALLGMAILLFSDQRSVLVLVSGVILVAASWVNVWIMFGVQYARHDVASRSLTFPGTDTRSFTDYLYVSLSAQATFGPGDVSATTTAMRRVMMYQFVIAFVFNSVILAMLVSLVLTQ